MVDTRQQMNSNRAFWALHILIRTLLIIYLWDDSKIDVTDSLQRLNKGAFRLYAFVHVLI